jgi:hypothetical protein
MLQAIENIVEEGTICNWEEHVAKILNTNYEECRKSCNVVRYPSVFIYISMLRLCLVK